MEANTIKRGCTLLLQVDSYYLRGNPLVSRALWCDHMLSLCFPCKFMHLRSNTACSKIFAAQMVLFKGVLEFRATCSDSLHVTRLLA